MGVEIIRHEIDLKTGDAIRVTSGPFESFIGTIENVNMEKQTFKVLISMFGRETPVELEFDPS
jgi:transcription termination/antitermination protein NusG